MKQNSNVSIELNLPNNLHNEKELLSPSIVKKNNQNNSFAPKIVKSSHSNDVLDSMNKEQVAEQCVNLLSKDIKDPMILELATVNCVVSNFQETFQNTSFENNQIELDLREKKLFFKLQCNHKIEYSTQYSMFEKQLMVGICVSDRLNTNQ